MAMAILWLESATILSLFFWSVRCQMFMENPGPVRPFDNLDARLHGTLRVQDGICLNHYSLKKGSVVQVSNSEKLGGRLLNATTGLTAEACLTRCCQLDPCTVAAFEQQGRLACYLFDCGYLDEFKCELVPYSDYGIAILTAHRDTPVKEPKLMPVPEHTPSESRTQGKTCKSYQFRCKTSGECVAGYDRCNGAYECPDRSDEENCDQYQREMDVRNGPPLQDGRSLEDELRTQNEDDSDREALWDRGRNRLSPQTTPENAVRNRKPIANQWNFRQDITSPPTKNLVTLSAAETATSAFAARTSQGPVHQVSSSSPTVPMDRISTTISIVSSANPHDIQTIHVEKSDPFLYASWANFSDPSHFIVSVVLIVAILFCGLTTMFVICRCICRRKPQVTKYRIVDPDAEDFLLGGNA